MTGAQNNFDAVLASRHRWGSLFEALCLGAIMLSLLVLCLFLASIVYTAWGWIDVDFLTSHASRFPRAAGIKSALWGSMWLILLTALFTIPIGVGAAVYLEEYSRKNRLTTFIQVNLSNLAGVPSIVYGILGMSVFARMFDAFAGSEGKVLSISLGFTAIEIPIPFGPTLISGALTLSLLILPIVIIASQEALRSVPPSLRHASLALGATEWQTIRTQVLPASLPGMATGVILALSRAIGETAPLLLIGAVGFIPETPGGIDGLMDILRDPGALLEIPFSRFTCMPMQIYLWVDEPDHLFRNVAAAGIVVLLVVLLLMNAAAVYIRMRFQKKIQW